MPTVNKIDLPHSNVDGALAQMSDAFDLDTDDALRISAKTVRPLPSSSRVTASACAGRALRTAHAVCRCHCCKWAIIFSHRAPPVASGLGLRRVAASNPAARASARSVRHQAVTPPPLRLVVPPRAHTLAMSRAPCRSHERPSPRAPCQSPLRRVAGTGTTTSLVCSVWSRYSTARSGWATRCAPRQVARRSGCSSSI